MQLSGNGCTACLGKRKHRRNGENQGFFNHRADSLLACSCYIPRAGWKVTRCFQGWLPTGERCVEVSRLHAAVPHLLGLKAPRGGSGAPQRCCCWWSAQQGPFAALGPLPVCSSACLATSSHGFVRSHGHRLIPVLPWSGSL